MAMSAYLAEATLDATLSTAYLGLFTTSPGEDGLSGEVAGGAYARVSVPFSTGSPHVASTTAQAVFPQAQAAWGTVSFIGIFDAASSGHLLFSGALETPVTINSNAIVTIDIGNVTVTLS